MAPSIAALSRIQPLTTVLELEEAVVNAQQAGRLLVVKAYAPWCSACKVIEPKYKRAASSNLEVDFCDIDFVQAKALCKDCGVEKLPTGMIFKDGKKVEHSCVRSSEFSGFMSRLWSMRACECGSGLLHLRRMPADGTRDGRRCERHLFPRELSG